MKVRLAIFIFYNVKDIIASIFISSSTADLTDLIFSHWDEMLKWQERSSREN
jgi:hypothetical protein